MTITEVEGVETFLYDTLSANGFSLPVYSGIAPDDADLPFYLFAYIGGTDTNGAGNAGVRVLTRFRYIARAYGQGPSFAAIKAEAKWLDDQLHGAAGTDQDGRVVSCVRAEPFALREPGDDGQWMVTLGGIYDITIG